MKIAVITDSGSNLNPAFVVKTQKPTSDSVDDR